MHSGSTFLILNTRGPFEWMYAQLNRIPAYSYEPVLLTYSVDTSRNLCNLKTFHHVWELYLGVRGWSLLHGWSLGPPSDERWLYHKLCWMTNDEMVGKGGLRPLDFQTFALSKLSLLTVLTGVNVCQGHRAVVWTYPLDLTLPTQAAVVRRATHASAWIWSWCRLLALRRLAR